ncbi:MAG: T9SS type A sorting domain-containing protein, partial [Flavobacteriaceae bacterium]
WKAVLGKDPIKHFFISFTDDKCDIPGNGNSLFEIDVKASIATGPDRNVCKGDTVFLEGYGNNSFKWKSVYGDPLITGVNWFPDTNIGVDTNKFVKFLPTKTTSLAIEAPSARGICSGIVQNCFSKDTMKINVTQAYQIRVPNDTLICNPAAGSLTVSPSKSNLKYTYKWSPSGTLNNDTLKSPRFSNVLRNTKYYVTVTSDSGCVRQDSIQVNVTNPFPQNMRAMATDTLVCLWDTIGMWVNTGSINYGSCDTNIYPCLGKNESKTIGSGAIRNVTGQNTAPAIYASRNRSVKTQFLYTAADLKARGIGAGPITSIGFNIVQLGGQGANPFGDFTLKMGCTPLAKLSTSFVPDLKVVSDAKSHIPVLGWNTHLFDRDYVWDGVSNLIVEVCWDNGANSYNWDHIMSFDATNYESSIRYYSTTANGACNAVTPTGAAMFILPHTKFEVCSGIQKSNYRFQWMPDPITTNGGFVSATNTDSTNASVNLTTAGRYKVLVSDTSGVCFDTLFQKITVVSRYNVKPDSLPLQCVDAGVIRLTSPTPHTVSNPGGRWTGVGITNNTLGYWSTSKSGIGRFPVTYSVSGDACANSGTTFIHVVGYPDATILKPDSICGLYGNHPRHALEPKILGGYFSGNGVDSVVSAVPPFRTLSYYIDGTKFSPTSGSPDIATINYRVYKGCWNDSTMKVPVVAPFDTTYLGAMYHGVPIFTTEFCATSKADTLAVKGKGGSWRSLQFSSGVPNKAMTDTNRGIFNPRLINNGSGGRAYIEVSRAGFCGDTGRYKVEIMKAPQVEILAENFCFSDPGDCIGSNILAADRKKLIKVRVAKFPNRVIDNSNPATYVDVVTATKAQTGWSNLIESDKVTKWDGNPWMIFPYKCEYPFCQLPIGRYPISYSMALNYRQGSKHPDSICTFIHDTAIYISDTIRMKLVADGDLCAKSSVTLNSGATGSKYTYKWSDGSKNGSLTTSTVGTYTVTVTSPTCETEDSITLSYCVGLEELNTSFEAKLFPNPTRDNIHLEMDHIEEQVTLSIFTMTGQLVDEFKFEPINGKLDAEINVSKLPAGVYSFRVSSAIETNTYRVVIE